jgi:hypothetical protein
VDVRTLGVNGAGDVLYLAAADDGTLVDVEPYTFVEPAGLAAAERYKALRALAEKVVRSSGVERVRILDPELSYQAPVVSVQARIALETLLMLGATDAGVDCARLSRTSLRTVLGLPKKGQIVDMVGDVTGKVGPHWGPRKRDLAALAAIAASRQP